MKFAVDLLTPYMVAQKDNVKFILKNDEFKFALAFFS